MKKIILILAIVVLIKGGNRIELDGRCADYEGGFWGVEEKLIIYGDSCESKENPIAIFTAKEVVALYGVGK